MYIALTCFLTLSPCPKHNVIIMQKLQVRLGILFYAEFCKGSTSKGKKPCLDGKL